MEHAADNLAEILDFNLETAQIEWRSLQRFFAQGSALAVEQGVDLVDVAQAFADDDNQQVEKWLATNQVQPVPNDLAKKWYDDNAVVWAVVASPWVLVQAASD